MALIEEVLDQLSVGNPFQLAGLPVGEQILNAVGELLPVDNGVRNLIEVSLLQDVKWQVGAHFTHSPF